jgi:response regulator RpfG family c-di-GMP phosphodiesterase
MLALAEMHICRGQTTMARALLLAARSCSIMGVDTSCSFARIEGLLAIADGHFEQGVAQISASLAARPSAAYDDEVFDALHALERVHREHGYAAEADAFLRRIGDEMAAQARRLLDGLRAVPAMAEHVRLDGWGQSAHGGHERQFKYLVATASSQSSLEESSGEHGLRVARLARLLAQAAGLEAREIESIERGALLHDVGLIGVPSKVVSKCEDLSDAEQGMYDDHVDIGSDLVERAGFDGRQTALNIVRYHHAAFDGVGGNGAPVAGAIPLEARIVALCDAFDELITGKPRQAAVSVPEAMRRLLGRRGRDFDPKLTDLLIEIVRRLGSEHEDLKAYLSSEADDIEYFAAQRALRRATSGISKEASSP